jgi:hypothetical protein
LGAGQIVEIAGYRLSGALAAELDNIVAPLSLPDDLGSVTWIEVGAQSGTEISSANASIIDSSREAGVVVNVKKFQGEAFWASTEIVCIDSLIKATFMELNGAGEAGSEY